MIRESHHQVRFSANVWAGVVGNQILGPYFIEGRLTGGTYLDVLRTVISDLVDDVPLVQRSAIGGPRSVCGPRKVEPRTAKYCNVGMSSINKYVIFSNQPN